MDSDDSRPGSSVSNSSSDSSDNSRQSSPSRIIDNEGPKSPVASSPESVGRRSRPRSRSSTEGIRSPRSPSKSDSESSSSSSSSTNENEEPKSPASPPRGTSGASSNRSSSNGSHDKITRVDSRNQSVSPVKSHASSRNSSYSSHGSRNNSRENHIVDTGINISHEDLSDVSDMGSEKRGYSLNNSKQSMDEQGVDPPPIDVADNEMSAEEGRRFPLEVANSPDAEITDLRQKLDKKKGQDRSKEIENNDLTEGEQKSKEENGKAGESLEDFVKTHDEDALDFEAEEGECPDMSKDEEKKNGAEAHGAKSDEGDGECGEELEEGEVSDEDEKRPEETEPKPVCRFYTRGQCTWGMSCRFLHPGVTDKGNYTMFDLVRPVPVLQTGSSSRSTNYPVHTADYHDYRTERPALQHRAAIPHPSSAYSSHHDPRAPTETPVIVESAWERGLRTAKEMMRKANKRKEQDIDFEDKKMNLTLSPDEMEKDPYYLKDRGSPPEQIPSYGRHAMYPEANAGMYSPPDRFGRGPPVPPYDEVDPYGRTTRYRELPPHRMPQYEDERRVRPAREVIVQRVEPIGRGDEWNDPWMRSKSPGGRTGSRERGDKRRRDRRSYSSNSSYSSSSTSASDSSSNSSASPSPSETRRRYNSNSYKMSPRRHAGRAVRSPSSLGRRSKRSPSMRLSPVPKRRGHMSPSPVVDKRVAYSPVHKRKNQSPAVKKVAADKIKGKRRRASSSSGSGSSDSSASESDSDSGSSSSDTSKERTPPTKRTRLLEKLNDKRAAKKVDPPKKRSPISIELKKQATVGASALASPTHSTHSEKQAEPKKSRREELLKQLRAVEDAIAKKRSKLA